MAEKIVKLDEIFEENRNRGKMRRHSGDEKMGVGAARKRNWSGESKSPQMYPPLKPLLQKDKTNSQEYIDRSNVDRTCNPQIQELISLCKKFSMSIKNIAEDQNKIKD